MRILVKLGGTLLDAPESRKRLAHELAQIAGTGVELMIVHGGGKQMTRFLSERGIESTFIGGLRVTTPDVIDAVLKVLAGSVNHELVSSLVEAGVLAVGLSGIDACLTEAEPLSDELGAVGRPVRTDGKLLDLLASNGYLPVVACVAGDRQGRIFNVNADQMAVSCAAGFRADRLFFLTDVDGVMDSDKSVIPHLSSKSARQLIESGVATGGMQAKINAATDALSNGIAEVVIAPGAAKWIVCRLLAGETVGTRLSDEGGGNS